jgi:predicted metal-dependent hydrolase
MPSKKFELAAGLPITIYKRRGNRNLRLSISGTGEIRVSIPAWAPYKTGLDFARSRQDWIVEQSKQPVILTHGQPVGKAHHLEFAAKQVSKPSGRIKGSAIIVSHPPEHDAASPKVQAAARRASEKALRLQAEQLLPQRLELLAKKHGFNYRSVGIRRLKGRWGSCDQAANIVLNLFLMQLPWELIDYVLLHELAHTRVLRHGPDFWAVMEQVKPDAKKMRAAMRLHQPVVS